jgi:hypothetical protein
MTTEPLVLAALAPAVSVDPPPPGARWRVGDEPVDGWIVVGMAGLDAVPAGEPALVIADGPVLYAPPPSVTLAPSGAWFAVAVAAWCGALGRERALRRALRHDLYGQLAVASGHLDLLEEPALGPLSDRQRASVRAARRALLGLTEELRALADRAVARR